jgi:hypothetical protein
VNLHAIVSGAVGSVNPLVNISIQRSNGSTTNVDGTRVPSYAAAVTVQAQVQPLSAGDLQQIEGLNIQGEKRAVYINGRTDGLIRQDQKGGDLITFNSQIWLNVHVLEYWPDWCKFIITRQDGS